MDSQTLTPPLRLGFAAKVLGEPNLKSSDARRWQSNPHLKVSIQYLHAIFDYLGKHRIDMYRMSSDLAPYVTHPDMPQFHHQVAESYDELVALGDHAKALNLRLSFHPTQFVILNSPDRALVDKSIWDLESQAEILDAMGLGPDAVMIIHVGGAYGDRPAGCARFVETYKRLPEAVRRRLVLENDDLRYSAADVLSIHAEIGVPLVFDVLHYWCNNPEQLPLRETMAQFVHSWPAGVRPKMHYSSPRTESREITRKDRKTGKNVTTLQPPIWTGHAGFINPFEFITFMRLMEGLEFDVMLESKEKDLALLRLRRDLPRYAPDVSARFGETPTPDGIAPAEEDATALATALAEGDALSDPAAEE